MTRYGPHWKRRLLKIPQNIRDKVARLKQDTCVIACSIRIPKRSIQGGVYKHIGIVWNDGVAVFPHKIGCSCRPKTASIIAPSRPA